MATMALTQVTTDSPLTTLQQQLRWSSQETNYLAQFLEKYPKPWGLSARTFAELGTVPIACDGYEEEILPLVVWWEELQDKIAAHRWESVSLASIL